MIHRQPLHWMILVVAALLLGWVAIAANIRSPASVKQRDLLRQRRQQRKQKEGLMVPVKAKDDPVIVLPHLH